MRQPQPPFGDDAPTAARPARLGEPPDGAPSSDGGRFVPGTLIAGRYRIVALLGRGGMGQVYRAEDLKLSQPVALKFLPEALSRDGAALARFHQEVRLARQISHPSVCRVFDIGETGGEHFLTMEYIDGEDLASLGRRIGRLPADKALQVARQVAAGLAAAHEAGVLHRDLKPANVMIDGRGRARITDFGLAGLEADLGRDGDASGTPAYMAPEQLAGREFTRRSEVYALGLLLYELFTGHRLFDAATVPEVLRQRGEGVRADPTSVVKDLDPLVERVIRLCLEEDPARRPASVVQVAAALPGGDPLGAALAAGETPSPEMVAAASKEGALAARTANLLLGAVVLLLVLLGAGDRVNLHHIVPLEKSPEVLADRARTLLGQIGYASPPADRAFGFSLDQAFFGWDADPKPPVERWRRLAAGQPLTYYFWYRESPLPLEPVGLSRPTESDPPARVEGMARVVLDPRGRLVSLEVVPPAKGDAREASPGWTPLQTAAGLDLSRLSPTSPRWTLPVPSDEHVAWNATLPDQPDIAIRVEAGALAGRPVFFSLVTPWSSPPLAKPWRYDSGQWEALVVGGAVLLIVLGGGLAMARSNLRRGRGDRSGALKVSATVFAISVASGFLRSDPASTIEGVGFLAWHVATWALGLSAVTWLLYVALEPHVRRHRPELLVSWTRLLAGDGRDPLVGRDVLVGTVLGLAAAGAFVLGGWLKVVFEAPQPPNRLLDPAVLDGLLPALGELVGRAAGAIAIPIATLVFVALTRGLLRSDVRAAAALWAALWAVYILATARSWPMIVATGLWSAVAIGTVTRFGLVAAVAFTFVQTLASQFPLDTRASRFWAPTAAMVVAVILAQAIGAWRLSTGGRRGETPWRT